jgi:hypothetical protein
MLNDCDFIGRGSIAMCTTNSNGDHNGYNNKHEKYNNITYKVRPSFGVFLGPRYLGESFHRP